jgi:AraC-like DNA-binding protein
VRARADGASGARAVDVAARAGFADQSHMVREFRALAGVAPVQLLREGRLPGA